MFFWFTNDNTFSIIDALLKLFLVINGSALIICFCHKLTNYKKTRRYKSSNPLHQVLEHPANRHHHHHHSGLLNGGASGGQFSPQQLAAFASSADAHHLFAYDPYNSQLRQFACPALSGQHHIATLEQSQNGAFGFQPNGIDTLAALNQSVVANDLLRNSSQILVSSNTDLNSTTTNLIANPVYSSTLAPFQHLSLDNAYQRTQLSELNNNDDNRAPDNQASDLCPSYEEAIAAGGGGPSCMGRNEEASEPQSPSGASSETGVGNGGDEVSNSAEGDDLDT